MPSFPALTPTQISRVLQRKGFVLDRIKGSHHIYLHPKTKRRAVVPFHKKDLPTGTALAIMKQAGIDKDELQELL
jgi:predicted RNA binding protein YcfA (HicA-like mRNA interferase family)